jgi:hypothetical protein
MRLHTQRSRATLVETLLEWLSKHVKGAEHDLGWDSTSWQLQPGVPGLDP